MNAPVEPTVIPVLYGRAAQMCGQRVIQMFGQVAAFTQPEGWNPEVRLPPGWVTHYESTQQGLAGRKERLWRLSSVGISVQRFSAEEPIAPLASSVIQNGPLPSGASFDSNGYYKLALDVARSSGNARYLIDVGQTIEIYCYEVNVGLVAPANAFEVAPSNIDLETSLRVGLVVDSVIGTSLLPIESPIGNFEYKFTQRFFVDANTRVAIEVPRSAVSAKIYQGPQGVNSGDWGRFISDPIVTGIADAVGVITFANRTNITEHEPLADETHLVTNIDALVDRTFTVRWTIRP